MPIVRYELNEQVYESLKERLLTREFGGGERLALQALADRLDVSRSPVAHALTRLVAEGLVVSERRGFTVRPLTAALMVEAHEARLALELHGEYHGDSERRDHQRYAVAQDPFDRQLGEERVRSENAEHHECGDDRQRDPIAGHLPRQAGPP